MYPSASFGQKNPYIAGTPIADPAMFFGRLDVFEWIRLNVDEHPLVIHGQRRVGKTSVLRQLSRYLPGQYISVYYDLQGRTTASLEHFLYGLAREIARVLRVREGIEIPHLEREAFERDPDYFEREFLKLVMQKIHNRVLLICLDEFDTLEDTPMRDQRGRSLADQIRRVLNPRKINFIFSIGSSGNKLEYMKANFTAIFKTALYRKITYLDRDEAFRLIAEPVQEYLEYDRDAMEEIYTITSGHPYYIQLICHEIFSSYQKDETPSVTTGDVRGILEDVVERGTVNLKFFWDESEALEKWILVGLAYLSPEETTPERLSQFLGKQGFDIPADTIASVLLHLREKDILDDSNMFQIYLLKLWLRNNWTVEKVAEVIGKPIVEPRTPRVPAAQDEPVTSPVQGAPAPGSPWMPILGWVRRHTAAAAALGIVALFLIARYGVVPLFSPRDTPVPISAEALTPDATVTSRPAFTSTPKPTHTAAPTATPTPLFSENPVIDLSNASRVVEKAVWGKGILSDVDISPDGKLMALSTSLGIDLYELPGYRYLRTIDVPSYVGVATFSPDSMKIGATLFNDHAIVANVSGEGEVFSYYSISDMDFSPDGTTLALTDYGSQILFCDMETGTILEKVTIPGDDAFSIAYSPDGQYLATGARDKKTRVWRLSGGRPAGDPIIEIQNENITPHNLEFSPDSKLLAVESDAGAIQLVEIPAGNVLYTLSANAGGITGFDFSSNGSTLAVSHYDYLVRLWDVASGTLAQTLTGHDNSLSAVAFLPDDTSLITTSDDGTARVWNASSGSGETLCEGYSTYFNALDISPDGKVISAAGGDGPVYQFDRQTGELINTLVGSTDDTNDVAYSKDGRYLASASDDDSIRIWDLETGQIYRTLLGHTNYVEAIAFSPNGKTLVSGSGDQTVRLWDIISGKNTATLEGHIDAVLTVRFSPDGKKFVSGGGYQDKTIKVWDAETQALLYTLEGHTYNVQEVRFSPVDNLLASASGDDTTRIWDMVGGAFVQSLGEHDDWARSVDFSPDGSILVDASDDGTINLWNVHTGELLNTLEGPKWYIYSVRISPDGRVIAAGAGDGTIRLWAVPGEE